MSRQEIINKYVNKATILGIELLLITNICFAQSSIVTAGSDNITIGEVFPIMQTITAEKVVEVSLSTPKFEMQEKPIIKKKLTWWQKLLKAIFG